MPPTPSRSALAVDHPTWCDPGRCDVNGVDPIHIGHPATAHLDEASLDVEAVVYRIDEHNIHTLEPTGPVYGVEFHVPVDATDAQLGVLRMQLGAADVTKLQVLLEGRAQAMRIAMADDQADGAGERATAV